jgi:outer membrane immunogenic protein
MLRVMLLGAATLASLSAPALAQSTSPQTWTGAYVGVNLGAGLGDLSYPFTGTSAATSNAIAGKFKQSSSGGLIGGQIGYDYQLRNGVVLGLVADLDGSSISGDSNVSSLDSAGNVYSNRLKTQIDALGTVRGRIGVPMFGGRLLPYVTGGLAYGGVSTTAGQVCSACASGAGVSNYASQYDNRTGWAVGAGADYALSHHLSLRTEYLYTDLGRQTLGDGAGAFNAPGVNIDSAVSSVDASANIIRVGLNYKF